MRVLLVEDEKKTAAFVEKALRAEGMSLDWIGSTEGALELVRSTAFDVIVLDIMLPGQSGIDFLKSMRGAGVTTPVLLISARGAVNDRVAGLNAGADDFLPKPFELEELIARIRALARREWGAKSPVLEVADLTLNTLSRKATRAGRPIELTTREFRLLEFLMSSVGRVCSRMLLLEKVWDYTFDPGTNLVDVYIRRLRDKIDPPGSTKLLHSVRGTGYVLEERE